MNPHQHARMVECARIAKSGEGHTPETREAFRLALVKRRWLDDIARHSSDLFDRIKSDDRPAAEKH